ncbi:MAG: aminotransferase class IV [Marinifilaceae bacterium]
MSECYKYRYFKNNKLKLSEEFNDTEIQTGTSLYDVVRVMNGKALFLESHLQRLTTSAKLLKKELWVSTSEIKKKITQLSKINDVQEGNIKIVFNFFEKRRNFYCYFIPHKYPNTEQYQNGVKTILFQAVRETPNAKVINPWLRNTSNDIIKKARVYEIILLNRLGHITEGSRSNIFLIRNNTIYTAPLEDVLPGTVRQRVFDLCKKLSIPLVEKRIYFEDIPKYDAAFLTGTSPMLLPIRRINSLGLNVNHPLLLTLISEHHKMISTYLQNH